MSYWSVIWRFTWIVTAVLLVIGLVTLFMPKCRSFQDLQSRRLTLTEENGKLHGQILFVTLSNNAHDDSSRHPEPRLPGRSIFDTSA